MERTKIYLIRHGESLGNAVRQLLGHTDLDLSPLGYRQADLTATALSSVQIDEVYSSDLLRAYNTALPHAKMRGLEVQGRTELRELFLGDWEGLRVEEVMQKYGGKSIVIGSHGTAMSTVLNYFDRSFGYEDFERIRCLMPWAVRLTFEGENCTSIESYDLFIGKEKSLRM